MSKTSSIHVLHSIMQCCDCAPGPRESAKRLVIGLPSPRSPIETVDSTAPFQGAVKSLAACLASNSPAPETRTRAPRLLERAVERSLAVAVAPVDVGAAAEEELDLRPSDPQAFQGGDSQAFQGGEGFSGARRDSGRGRLSHARAGGGERRGRVEAGRRRDCKDLQGDPPPPPTPLPPPFPIRKPEAGAGR